MNHDFIERVVNHPAGSRPEFSPEDEETILFFDWRETEDAIVTEIAARLGLPALVCKLIDADNEAGYEAVVQYEGRSRRISLRDDRSMQGDTLLAVQTLLRDDYQIRYVSDTNGSDKAGVVVGPAGQWDMLYHAYGKGLSEHFVPIAELPDIFTTPGHELDAAIAAYAERVG